MPASPRQARGSQLAHVMHKKNVLHGEHCPPRQLEANGAMETREEGEEMERGREMPAVATCHPEPSQPICVQNRT